MTNKVFFAFYSNFNKPESSNPVVIKRQEILILISYLIVVSLYTLTLNNSFFWDTIQLGSKHANYYYTNNFTNILLPNSIDSGHIPTFGMYLALIWKIFGRNLMVSHLAMLPFVIGILWQLHTIVNKFIKKEYIGWALLLVLLDPTLLSQITLVSPDVPLVFFFLLGLNSLLDNKKKTLSLSIAFLFLTSIRGMMVSLCLLIIDIICNISFSNSIKGIFLSLLKRSTIYFPALFIFISFSTWHYLKKGWIGFHDNSPWAELFESVGFKGILYNIGILGWRIIDFGRIGIWIVFFVLFFKFKWDILKVKETRLLVLIFLILIIFLPVNMVWARNLLGHRYLLPIYLSFSLLCANILFTQNINEKLRLGLIYFWLLLLITGNLWVYPDKIAKGWDSTLAHLPYYKIRQKALKYLDSENIDYQNVQSFFPNNSVIDDADLNYDYRKLTDFNNCCDYVIYSNVFNISDEDYNLVKNQYSVIKQFKRGFLHIDICKKTELPKYKYGQ
jgi:hypothetical protein